MPKIEIQKAKIKDIPKIRSMINRESIDNGTIKTRSLRELYSRIREIYIVHDGNVVIASGALRIHSENLAEINCFVVSPEYRRKKIGSKILKKLIGEAKSYGIPRVISLTYTPAFFIELGFAKGTKEELAQKLNNDCLNCERYPDECKAEFYIRYL
jgi:N-acetylglutamate synthase-like GNAT family acetyltransferase